ncbi:MAG TPA: crosslink repair DNA glycosylase YcaQ family protein [Gemmatimonadaceae bacterium]|nr:crosslink repair DNA glycosylase YcaQ family protein [Gemmatimonadaceae bacterium]
MPVSTSSAAAAAKLRAWWSHRQGLDGSLAGHPPAAVLERAGWARSVGGVGPYLTLHARAGTGRAEADAAVARLEIHELPSARGCTYVLPASDFALGLALGRASGDAERRVATKLGVTEPEIDALCDAVLRALDGGTPLEPEAIRAATGDASRSLGEAGKKKGLTTTLPVALGLLQARGEIRRVPVNGRLDQQRYAYVRWTPGPLGSDALSPEEAHTELARRFFRWVGPATLAEFQWFSGLGVKAARQAVEPLGLVPMAEGSDRLLLPEDVDAFHAFEPPAEPHYVLVSSLDPISATRRDVASLLDERDRERPVMVDAGRRPMGGLADLPSHAILDRGRLVGLWEFDPDEGAIVWATFGVKPTPALRAAIKATEAFVRDDLGDARAFSLDSPTKRRPRIEGLRGA